LLDAIARVGTASVRKFQSQIEEPDILGGGKPVARVAARFGQIQNPPRTAGRTLPCGRAVGSQSLRLSVVSLAGGFSHNRRLSVAIKPTGFQPVVV
jgi:hypothetical protein